MNLTEEDFKVDFKFRGWNLFFHNIKSFVSKRLIHVAKMNRISGVKIGLLELAIVDNGNANRMREEEKFTEL